MFHFPSLCARFLPSLAHTLRTWGVTSECVFAKEIMGHVLLNEHGELSLFFHNSDEVIIPFEFKELKKTFFVRKKSYREKRVRNRSLRV